MCRGSRERGSMRPDRPIRRRERCSEINGLGEHSPRPLCKICSMSSCHDLSCCTVSASRRLITATSSFAALSKSSRCMIAACV